MKKLYMQLRVGEKVAISFGLVGLLFLAVIWQYHQTLTEGLADYQYLLEVSAGKKSSSLLIENHMLQARFHEKRFLLLREETDITNVVQQLDRVRAEADLLAGMDSRGAEAGGRILALADSYRKSFEAVAEAWRIRGLDHNSGLQGAFRGSVHLLEARAANFEVGELYLQLLQIRRGEKDLGLRREQQYRDRVLRLLGAFEAKAQAAGLQTDFKQALLAELEDYRNNFLRYAETVLTQQDIKGGKGPFRQTAHRIENLLAGHHVPGLGQNILQLRRREKDYLLRDDLQYVDMALQELASIERRLEDSGIVAEDKQTLFDLVSNYRRDFLALVEQNKNIARLHGQMRTVATEVSSLVRSNVRDAEREMRESVQRINAESAADARFMLLLAAFASLLGIASVLIITLSIARPLRRMAGLLDQLAYEQPVERIPSVPGGRDEVNAMAQSVNAMADHKARFLDWWKASMREVDRRSAPAEMEEKRESLAQRSPAADL